MGCNFKYIDLENAGFLDNHLEVDLYQEMFEKGLKGLLIKDLYQNIYKTLTCDRNNLSSINLDKFIEFMNKNSKFNLDAVIEYMGVFTTIYEIEIPVVFMQIKWISVSGFIKYSSCNADSFEIRELDRRIYRDLPLNFQKARDFLEQLMISNERSKQQ